MSSSSSEPDVKMKKNSVPKKFTKKTPTSPSDGVLKTQEAKKATTKQMIHSAISELTGNSRKGVSLHAIKKYMVDKYSVDIDRIGFLIKKNIKSGVEDGSILQTKGVGVSGSFRMSAKKKEKKKVAKAKTTKKTKESTEKSDKKETKKSVKVRTVTEDADVVKKKKTDEIKTKTKIADKKEKTLKKGAERVTKTAKTKQVKKKETKTSDKVKEIATPAKKKAAMMKRKSIGSIIKPPKMKPKARD